MAWFLRLYVTRYIFCSVLQFASVMLKAADGSSCQQPSRLNILVVGRRHWGVPGVKTRGKAQIRIIVNSNGDWWRQGSEFLSVCPTPVWLDLSLLGRSKSHRTTEEITLPPLFIRDGATWAGDGGLYGRMNSLHKCRIKIKNEVVLIEKQWQSSAWRSWKSKFVKKKQQKKDAQMGGQRHARLSRSWKSLWVMDQADQACLFQRRRRGAGV